ncbi:MAG: Phosphodiester glycosidase [Betaproteobacteria bacterium]|nr:Phosphodiester glycosidase [Betaproteobacteria bacterium]
MTAFMAALCAWLLIAAAWAQSPNRPGAGDEFSVNTGPRQEDPVACFDRSLRTARAAQQAYQVVYGSEWARQGECAGGTAEGAPGLGACWSPLTQARSLLEQAARLFETGRRTPGRQQSEVIAQANALVRQAAAQLDGATQCFRPVFAQWQTRRGGADGTRRATPPAPERGGPMPWEQAADAAEPQRPRTQVRVTPLSPAQQAATQLENSWRPLKAGVSYATTMFNGQPLHAVKITGPIRIGYAPQGARLQGFIDGTGTTLDNRGTRAIGAVTGTFSDFRIPKRGEPEHIAQLGGPVVQDGKLVAPLPPKVGVGALDAPRSFLGYGPNGYFIEEIEKFATPEARAAKVVGFGGTPRPGGPLLQGVGGLGQLLHNGIDVHKDSITHQVFKNSGQLSDTANANAVAGILDRNTLYLLVEEGNGNLKRPTGAGAGQLAAVLQELQVKEAVMMDGGGSAQMYIQGVVDTRPGSSGRKLPSAILF